jgi:thioredoxin
VVEVDASNFEALVLRSPVAVILDAYADWCEPCKQLTPRLEAVAKAARGALRLAKLNVDVNPGIAQSLQIKSLPTVLGVVGGRVVDGFLGAVPDEQMRAFLEKTIAAAEQAGFVPDVSAGPKDPVSAAMASVDACLEMLDDGDVERALTTLPGVVDGLTRLVAAVTRQREAHEQAAQAAAAATASGGTGGAKKPSAPPVSNAADALLRDLALTKARALAGIVRACVAAGQAVDSLAMAPPDAPRDPKLLAAAEAAAGDADGMYAQARTYADILRSQYKAHVRHADVARALTAADLAANASQGEVQVARVVVGLRPW